MRRDDKTKCECGGDTEYYSGALGYEAMQCKRCGHHWSGQTAAQHERQLFEYRLIKQAVTRDLIASCQAFVDLYSRDGAYVSPLMRVMLDDAKATLDQAKVESN